DADVVGGVGGGHLPGDGDDAALGGGVGEDAGEADEAADAGLVDDDAAAALHHVRQRVPGGQPDALEVDGDDPVPLLLGGVGGVAGAGDARVGEDDVDPVEAGEGLLGHPFGVGGGGDVGGQGDGGTAGLAVLLGDPAGRVRVEVDAGDPGALRGETQGAGAAEARSGSGDQRDLVRQAALCGHGSSRDADNIPKSSALIITK